VAAPREVRSRSQGGRRMQRSIVRDFMTPVAELPAVGEDQLLPEAARVLKASRQALATDEFRFRSLIVKDARGTPIGKLSLLDIITAFEPKYWEIPEDQVNRFGYDRDHLRDMFRSHGLWEDSLKDICPRAARLTVGELMSPLRDTECLREDDTLSFAVHQLIVGRHRDLVVKDKAGLITGVLRMARIYTLIEGLLGDCEI
jgi:CBS domain-containing protein